MHGGIFVVFCEYSSLLTESDVEQKFIYPFLTMPYPMGLGLDSSQILTKSILRQVKIGKGQTKKYYYPDYLVSIRGIPVLIVEAKKPSEELEDAYSEARLYAQEVNATFGHNINTCQIVIACNGTETWAGYSDSAVPHIKVKFEEISSENINYINLLKFCSNKELEEYANKPYQMARGNSKFNTPVSLLGGKRVQNEELEENPFGRTFIFENRRIFDPETEYDRSIIVENAYIPSAKREQHIEPIYKEIRKFEIPGQDKVVSLATKEPVGLVQRLSLRIDDRNEAYSLFLIIGNVGSGKTTFIRYFQHIYLAKQHPQLANKCDWVFINMNQSPLTRIEIYNWIKNKIINELESNHNEINFYSLEIIKKIFRKEIYEFDVGIGSLLKNNESQYNIELYKILKEKMEDKTIYLKSLISYIKEQHYQLPIIVLDNCDKRNKEEQLLMFEVSQWLRTTFKCIIILPMRDNTYDQYKEEPPLDTVVKDLVFRIDPPDLMKVIQARLDYIIRITSQTDSTYVLENGINVSVKKSDLIEYFKCIMIAIRNNTQAYNVFYRLSDKNTRKGIQLFEDFCKSGYNSANDFFMIRHAGQDYQLPSYKFLNALLRKNRRYFNGEYSNFVNLFYSNYLDDFPDYFIRIDILRWLNEKYIQVGPSKIKGMFPVRDIMRDMQIIGHKLDASRRELNYLLKRELIIAESLLNVVNDDDLVKITIPGKLHLNLLKNVTYLAACAEDISYKNSEIMTSISKRIALNSSLSKISLALTAQDFISYLITYRKEYSACPSVYLANDTVVQLYDLKDCTDALEKWIENDPHVKKYFCAISQYKSGTEIIVKISSISKGAVICTFIEDNELKGFISVSDPKYNLTNQQYDLLNRDSKIKCNIIAFDLEHYNFQLKYISTIEE